jgi:hypothetical protein
LRAGTRKSACAALKPQDSGDWRGAATGSLRAVLSLVLFVELLAGCGGGAPKFPYQLAPVSGKVTSEDGSPLSAQPLLIVFTPEVPAVSVKETPRAATGNVDPKDGSFVLTTISPGDGAIVGPGKFTFGPSPDIPDEYLAPITSPLAVEVKPGSNVFGDLKVKKPAAKAPAKAPPTAAAPQR